MSSIQKNSKDQNNGENEDILSYRFLLGDMGIQMLVAIMHGASTKETIMMLSGVPMSCVKGRLPVLMSLELVSTINGEEYFITPKGYKFLKLLEKN